MTDIKLDDIPVCVDMCKYREKKFPWVIVILTAIIWTGAGYMAGWMDGYVTGVRDSSSLIEQTFELKDSKSSDGHMPW